MIVLCMALQYWELMFCSSIRNIFGYANQQKAHWKDAKICNTPSSYSLNNHSEWKKEVMWGRDRDYWNTIWRKIWYSYIIYVRSSQLSGNCWVWSNNQVCFFSLRNVSNEFYQSAFRIDFFSWPDARCKFLKAQLFKTSNCTCTEPNNNLIKLGSWCKHRT